MFDCIKRTRPGIPGPLYSLSRQSDSIPIIIKLPGPTAAEPWTGDGRSEKTRGKNSCVPFLSKKMSVCRNT